MQILSVAADAIVAMGRGIKYRLERSLAAVEPHWGIRSLSGHVRRKRRGSNIDRSGHSILILVNETQGCESGGAAGSGLNGRRISMVLRVQTREDLGLLMGLTLKFLLLCRQIIFPMQHIVLVILSGQTADSQRMITKDLPINSLSRELYLRFKPREYAEAMAAKSYTDTKVTQKLRSEHCDVSLRREEFGLSVAVKRWMSVKLLHGDGHRSNRMH